MRKRTIWLAGLSVVGLVGGPACGSGKAKTAAGTTAAPAPASAAPTAPAPTAPPVFPLTGLPVTNAAMAQRTALSVKIDNARQALPQSGLNSADIVTEAVVEGGLTRLLATFHSHDVDPVGPIRSARPVDADLLDELNGGIFAFSGGALGELAPVRAHSRAVMIFNDQGNRGFYRSNAKPAPYNLFGTTAAFYAEGARVAKQLPPAPPQLFQYSAQAPASGPAGSVSLPFSNFRAAGWTWSAGAYQRNQDAAVDKLADGSTVTADNVVIMSVAIRGTGIFDTAHNEDPLVVVIGSGDAWLMRDGVMVPGKWTRPSTDVPVKLTDTAGNPMLLKPGRTWLELLPQDRRPVFS